MKHVNKLGLGTVQFGIPYGISNKNGQTSLDEIKAVLNFAADVGINLLDTASAYGNAEENLGKNVLTNFSIVSKFASPLNNEKITTQLNQTLQNLKVKSIYGYLAHRPNDLVNHPEQWEEISDLKNSGVISKIGFSLNSPSELSLLLEKGFFPDLVQVPFNYFDRRFEQYFTELKKINCEIHIRSVFLQGVFFVDTETLPQHFEVIKPIVKDLQNATRNLSAALLKFVLKEPLIDKVILGVESQSQLESNIDGLKDAEELPDREFKFDENILMPMNWPK